MGQVIHIDNNGMILTDKEWLEYINNRMGK